MYLLVVVCLLLLLSVVCAAIDDGEFGTNCHQMVVLMTVFLIVNSPGIFGLPTDERKAQKITYLGTRV